MAYKTEGIVKTAEINETGVKFTIQPVSPYSFDELTEIETKKFLILVNDTTSSSPRSAEVISVETKFEFAFGAKQPENLASFFILIQNRQKICVTCDTVKKDLVTVSRISIAK